MATTNHISADASIAESYWKVLSPLGDGAKLRLVTMLTTSIVEKIDKKETSSELTARMLKKYNGTWMGDESPEEIMSAIRENSSIRNAVNL